MLVAPSDVPRAGRSTIGSLKSSADVRQAHCYVEKGPVCLSGATPLHVVQCRPNTSERHYSVLRPSALLPLSLSAQREASAAARPNLAAPSAACHVSWHCYLCFRLHLVRSHTVPKAERQRLRRRRCRYCTLRLPLNWLPEFRTPPAGRRRSLMVTGQRGMSRCQPRRIVQSACRMR